MPLIFNKQFLSNNYKMTEIKKRKRKFKIQQWKWICYDSNNKYYASLLFTTLFILMCFVDCIKSTSVSQISPKSNYIPNISERVLETVTSSSPTTIAYSDSIFLDLATDSSSIPSSSSIVQSSNSNDDEEKILELNEGEIHYSRIQRSASPILNEIPSKSSLKFDDINELKMNDDANSAGRYFNYIKPTSTVNNVIENADITKSQRSTKDSNDGGQYFLSKRGPRSQISGSPINPTNVMPTTETVMSTNKPSNPRQNHNPDIQDIITGIVKLLNGNVNVHANTQAQRRPVASRINNRGPPRISEAQPLPIDFDIQKAGSSMRPPPYPFDRPEGAIRPFITGVPIPEQIVPSVQQNYRPGFISQNRHPWHRPRPRPPFNNRRPIPPYKPLPPIDNYNPDEELQITTMEAEGNNETSELSPTGATYDSELSSLDKSQSPSLSTARPSEENTTNVSDTVMASTKKEDHLKKKDTMKNKSIEKKPVASITKTTNSDDMTTIIQSTSVVHTAQVITTTTQQELSYEITSSSAVETSTNDIFPSLSSSINSDEIPVTTTITTPLSVISLNISSTITTSTDSSLQNSLMSSTAIDATATNLNNTFEISSNASTLSYHPRPGIVLDDPEFKPGGHGKLGQRPQRPIIQSTRHHPPGYGEIFDVTLSAIQGPGSVSGSQQTINIKPHGYYGNVSAEDIIISPSGDEGFVSIDGKRTYINLFGELTDVPAPTSTQTIRSSQTSSHSVIPHETEYSGDSNSNTESNLIQPTKPHKPHIQPTQKPSQRPHYRPRTTQPPVRIDTCIVGDDSTCDQAQNEKCKTENGVSSCHCRPGYSRRKHREPCRRVVSFFMSIRVDRIYERRIVWDKLLLDKNSEPYDQLSYESVRAIDSAMSMTPFSDEFIDGKVNNIYRGDASQGLAGVFVNLTLRLEENVETLRPNLRNDIQKHLLGVLYRRNNNIGNSVLYVDSPAGSISSLHDLDECQSKELNDCHANAICTNMFGSFRCECEKGFRDPWSDQPQRAGKECLSCPESHCNNRGICSYEDDGTQICTCDGSYYGSQCEIDGEVLGVAIGASVAAVIIIVLTLICLIMWSRKWHREQKNTLGSPIFGYMTTGPVKSAITTQSPYQVTLDDRMRWAQIADVMAQANHYAAEPVAPPRPSSAMFGYPNLQTMNMGTLGGMSIAGTLPIHSAPSMPPVPLPRRLGLSSRSNGMRTLENSSSSEEEDRTDLLGRNFQVPRPKSRSNGSIANQSGIYYDVDYEPSGGGDMYGTTTTSVSNTVPNSQGIPMSTYTSGRTPSTYYMKR